ncbi:MarR family winged helix-turn-helix transcriptional regulator [Mycobacterium deserti]|uniref:MarR family winged helix-turn-helix transcriptional regulator n=1 Tax=Mycobacterium deserti TaxID=2978347 RepID=A0ABT2M4N0_9MYCO|nr:MarR family winged helix-turn-helix transcriptional regulator [Mycobacterium deserti]MCT7657207.1 MarR family winged helix-turn-helix transcriptional regulator [Mycobacterium deserti]
MSTIDSTAGGRVDERRVREFQAASLQRHAIEFGEWMVRASNERARALGHRQLRPAHARLMVFLGWDGSRITDIARAQDVSKNAVSQLVTELEDLGYVERASDPADGRAKIVRYTREGRALIADAATIAERLDAEIEAIIGARKLADLRSTLAEICRHLGIGPAP